MIMVSTVRSNQNFISFDINHTLGFVANPRRFNVAITRAKALLIIVGDPIILSLDPMWRKFLNYIHRSGGWRGQAKDWPDDDEDGEDGQPRDFFAERRRDARQTIDDLAALMEEMVIEQLPEGHGREGNDEEAAQDRPWRENE